MQENMRCPKVLCNEAYERQGKFDNDSLSEDYASTLGFMASPTSA